ncbi:MAG: polynucleotide adenylyltransferase PcnB [Treponema sp.]|nr:polynucleotide adenylyltransferase PcnB [Treponema sp.]
MRYRYSKGPNGELEKKAVIYTDDEHRINHDDVDREAVSIIRKLRSAGYDSYIVGGAVRDLILGKKPKDFDIVSSASPPRIKKIFRNSRVIGRRFRLVHVYFPQRTFEVSTFRSLKDGTTSNTFGTIDEDVLRRDFSLNALYYDPEQKTVIDYVNGFNDIKKKLIKPIISLSEIFTDDPVRMIRAVKYGALTGFSLPLNLRMKITRQSNLLESISPSRLTEEIFKIINTDKASSIVDMLEKTGLYSFLQPQAARLMKKDPAFKKNYLNTMSGLKGDKNLRGDALSALFRDYLEYTLKLDAEEIKKIKTATYENYKEILRNVRSFVLPMNPPRYELEHAVKKFLLSYGITVKRTPPKTAAETPPAKRKKRRRKKKKITTPGQ